MSQREPDSKIRVVVVDDSAFMRGAITRLIGQDARFEVVAQAKDGLDAVKCVEAHAPDVVTMDFNMPGLNGAEATRAILAKRPVPIVMLSAHTREGARETAEALTAGAVDFVCKPQGEVSASLRAVRDELLSKLALAASANVFARARTHEILPTQPPRASSALDAGRTTVSRRLGFSVVVIASSTGGPAALTRVLSRLGPDLRAALVLVQHMPSGFTAALANQLTEQTRFPVREARAGESLAAGVALLAPGGSHLIVESGGIVVLTDDPPVHGVKPAADPTLRSVARAFGRRAIGVVLTGMGRDGALGLAAIKAAGGRTLAQDKASSTVYGMPRAAVELGVVEDVLDLDDIGRFLRKLILEKHR